MDQVAGLVGDAQLQRHVTAAPEQHVVDGPATVAGEEALAHRVGVDDEPQHGEVVGAPRVGPEEAEEDLPRFVTGLVGGGVDLLGRCVLCRQVTHAPLEAGVARELAAAAVEQHVAGTARRPRPGQETVDVRVRLEPAREVLRDEVEAAGSELGMVDRRQRVEDRPLDGPPDLDGDVGGRLFRQLAHDHLVLRGERRHRALLQVEDQHGGGDRGGDGQQQGRRTPVAA